MKETKMQLYFYRAKCGDAARIRFLGNDNKYHNVFIDSGFRQTFRDILKVQLLEIESNGEIIDLWVISHIHDDHIGGIEQYIKYIGRGISKDIVKEWYYNLPRNYVIPTTPTSPSISDSVSIRQGDILARYLYSIGKDSFTDITIDTKPFDLFGLKIHILSPSMTKLKKLRDKYEDASIRLEVIEGRAISSATSATSYDYHVKLKDFDLSFWNEDDSVENGSSISMLTEYNGKKILWLADSHPSIIVDSLTQLGYSNTHKLECEWVKVAHHGSKGNNSNELYSLINCNNYLFSADDTNTHKLPTKESIARILRNVDRDMASTYNIVFTYDNERLRSIFSNEESSIFEELNFTLVFNEEEFLKENL